ncbi:MAG: alpha-1,6-glucosidase domain-containing protein [Chloroflexota bacterium]
MPGHRFSGLADGRRRRPACNSTTPGLDQIPGAIVMSLSDMDGADLDPNNELIVTSVQRPRPESLVHRGIAGRLQLVLHWILAESADAVVRTATFDPDTAPLPGRAWTTVVFVLPEAAPEESAVVAAPEPTVPTETAVEQATPEAVAEPERMRRGLTPSTQPSLNPRRPARRRQPGYGCWGVDWSGVVTALIATF